jgi:glycosyltransferase involved in cell wall biosynthesis
MDQKTLALVMIVKNEEKGLRAAVESAKSVCNEIIIAVDISSVDGTLALARQLTPNVKVFDWCDDFAKTRNQAHLGVKSDYILFLDGHETLENPENVKKYLDGEHDGVLCRCKLENGCVFPTLRIYKNGLEFVGAVHEEVPAHNPIIAQDVFIAHHRLDSQDPESAKIREEQRDDQTPRVMLARIKADKKDTRAAFHLAGYFGSVKDYPNALKYQKLYLRYSKNPAQRWFIFYNRALIYFVQKKYFRAWLATLDAVAINPFRWEISELRGLMFFQQRQFDRALPFLIESLNDSKGEVAFQPKAHKLAVPWNCIGECFFNLGKYFEAGEAFTRARYHAEDKLFKKILERRANLMYRMAEKDK